jgi:NADPH:quinone reductase-like Zn-dependent oxidoreductase
VRTWHYEKPAGIDSLRLAEAADPKPGQGQVLIRIHAVSLNYKDLFVAKGMGGPNLPSPLIPLSDAAGEVVEVGAGVTRVRNGDRVMPIVAQSWIGGPLTELIARSVLGNTIQGVLAEYIVLHESGVVAIPEHLSFVEAATLPCAAATAWNALAVEGSVKAGQTVLILGTGGVSIFALQFAKALGARVIVTSSSQEKLGRARELGAFAGVNYKSNLEWDQEVLRLTGGRGVDHVIEVGGAGTLERSIRATRLGGTISLIGVLAGLEGSINPLPLLLKALRLQGTSVGPRDAFEDMNRAITDQALHPVIDRDFPFHEAREAMRYLESGVHFGKIVIRI